MMTSNALGPRIRELELQDGLHARAMYMYMHPEALRHHDSVDKEILYILPLFIPGSVIQSYYTYSSVKQGSALCKTLH